MMHNNDLASSGVNIVSYIQITNFIKPVGGERPSYDVKVPSGKGYTLGNYNSDEFVNSMCWEDKNGKRLKKTDTFKAGEKYTAQIEIDLLPAGEFGEHLVVTLNGEGVNSWYVGYRENYYYLYFDVTYTAYSEYTVNNIEITNFTKPVGGDRPSYDVKVPSGKGYTLGNYNNDQFVNSMCWQDNNGSLLKKTDTFKAGEKYTAQIEIDLLPVSVFGENFTVKLNGVEIHNWYMGYRENYYYLYFDVTYTASYQYTVNSIEITNFTKPYDGENPSYDVKIPSGKGYTLGNYNTDQFVNSMCWQDKNGNQLKKTDEFTEGEAYTAQIEIDLLPVSKPGESITVTLNGEEIHGWYMGFRENYYYLYFDVTYTATKPPIRSVEVSMVKEPVAGAAPSYLGGVPLYGGYKRGDVDNDCFSSGMAWRKGESIIDAIKINSGKTFIEGQKYSVWIFLTAKSGYEFADSGITAKINGNDANVVVSVPKKTILISYTFTCLPAGSVRTLHGSVTSYLKSSDNTTVQLIQNGIVKKSATVSSNTGSYSFSNVAEGNYTLRVSKKNHVTREYSFKMTNNKTLNVIINPLGDTNLNGKVDIKDVNRLYKHSKEMEMLTDPYALLCSNVNGDENVNIKDVNRLYKHVMETSPLYV